MGSDFMIAGCGGPSCFGTAACGELSLIPRCSENIFSISLSSTLNKAPPIPAAGDCGGAGIAGCGTGCPGTNAGGLIFNREGEPPDCGIAGSGGAPKG